MMLSVVVLSSTLSLLTAGKRKPVLEKVEAETQAMLLLLQLWAAGQ